MSGLLLEYNMLFLCLAYCSQLKLFLDSFLFLASLFLAVLINDFLISNASVNTFALFVASQIPLYSDADFFKSLADCFNDSDFNFKVSIF